VAITLKTLRDIESLLTSDRMTYKGSEVRPLVDILNEIAREQAEATKVLRVVPQQPLSGEQGGYNEQAAIGG
jgi:hypothetical protein